MERLGGLIHKMPRDGAVLPDRLRRDLGAAAAQRLRLGVADVPGDPGQSAAPAVGPQAPDPGGRRAARAVGGACGRLLRQGVRRHLPRPAAHARGRDGERSRSLLARRHVRARRALFARRRAARLRHRSAGAGRERARGRTDAASRRAMALDRSDRREPQLLQRPDHPCLPRDRSQFTAMFIHRFATRATRRSAIWDCGYPDPSPATQYTGSSFAMPIRRVFGTTVFQVREQVDMPRPGEMRPGAFPGRRCSIPPGASPTGRWRAPSGLVADKLNGLQFLTIRQYLTLTVSTLIAAAPGGRRMALMLELAAQAVQMSSWCSMAPLMLGITRKVQGAPAAPARSVGVAAVPRPVEAHAQGGGARAQRLLALPRRALSHLRRDLGRRGAGADLRHRAPVLLVRRPDRHRGADGDRHALRWRSPAWTSAPRSAASARRAR